MVGGMTEAIIVNVWPTKSTPFVLIPHPFMTPMTRIRAIELLKSVRDIPQPTSTPLPLSAVLQFPRYYLLHFNVYFAVKGVKRNLQPTRWFAVFDVDKVIFHDYWHPIIIDNLIDVLSRH
jgi:hypothetical protein